MIFLEAKKDGLLASDGEVEKVILDSFKDENGKFQGEQFSNQLKYEGYSESDYMEYVRRQITVEKFQRFIVDTTYVPSEAADLEYKLAETKMDVEYLKFSKTSVAVTVTPE